MAISFIGGYQNLDPESFKIVLDGGVDPVEEVEEVARKLFLIFRSPLSGLFCHERPVVGVLFSSWPHQVFQLQTIEDHPKMLFCTGFDKRLQMDEVIVDNFVEDVSDVLEFLG